MTSFMEGGSLIDAEQLKRITNIKEDAKNQSKSEAELLEYSKYIRNAAEHGLYQCEIVFDGYGCMANYNVYAVAKLYDMGYVTEETEITIEGPSGINIFSKVLNINWG